MSNIEQIDWGHWIYRLIAIIIDSIIAAIPAYIIYALALIPLLSSTVDYGYGVIISVAPWWAYLLLPFIIGIIQLLYFMILDTVWGGTIGKRILGLHVQTVNGGKVPFDKAFLRNISKIYGLLLLLDWLIGIVTPGDKRQKYMDRVAGTTVVSLKQTFSTTPPPPPPPPPT